MSHVDGPRVIFRIVDRIPIAKIRIVNWETKYRNVMSLGQVVGGVASRGSSHSSTGPLTAVLRLDEKRNHWFRLSSIRSLLGLKPVIDVQKQINVQLL